ncbi:WYL domain-containing protein [Myroides marinus]|uniref:helix-turn-helix transcriptional regulator n=1 Tax=Myroides marinus TaxID=703342 RepID=UPI002578DBCB|nr:WYL domain-containing protein [Myroides marinus]MDM1404701.1 WYL domain-containing protein [Myroides marinus]
MKELLRVYNVLTLFDKREYCTKDEILKAASKDEEAVISYETWNRLRKKLELDYGFSVIYHKSMDLYSISFGDKVDRAKLISVINHFKAINLLQTYIEEDKEMLDRLEFDEGMSTGTEDHINRLQSAMTKSESVILTHQGYLKEEPYQVGVNPLYFKQYQNRWYLIAEVMDKKEFRSFGMDRIKEVEYEGTKFKNRIKEAKKRFNEIIGVDLNGNGLQDIVIAFDPSQKPYLESLKLHHSQVVVSDTKEKYTIKIRVNPNYELQQQIQKYGHLAEVIEGDWICW